MLYRVLVLVALSAVATLVPTVICDRQDWLQSYALSRHHMTIPDNIFYLKDAAREELFRIFRVLHVGMERAGIPYFLTAGSLLGWKRHAKKMIPWDDDIDVAIVYPIQQNAWFIFKKYVQDRGYHLWVFREWFKITSPRIPVFNRPAIALDIFLYAFHKKTKVLRHASPIARDMWPKEQFPPKHVFPLQRTTFHGMPTYVPRHPEQVLAQSFGCEYLKVAYVNQIHSPLPFLAIHGGLRKLPSQIRL